MLAEPVLRRLILSRYLFELAIQNARSDQEVARAACVNLLQDSIEIFMLAALDHLDVRVAPKTEFAQYLDKINDAIGDKLPFRRRLIEINKVRVLSKDDGIPPNRREVEGYVSDARGFLEQACRKVFGVDYWSVSLVQLLDDSETKALLLQAQAHFEKGEYDQCLIACRKALYVEFESAYDTQGDLKCVKRVVATCQPRTLLCATKSYIEENVRTPFDHIHLDHSQLDADLTKEGIDHTSFWNVWRLTPRSIGTNQRTNGWLNTNRACLRARVCASVRPTFWRPPSKYS